MFAIYCISKVKIKNSTKRHPYTLSHTHTYIEIESSKKREEYYSIAYVKSRIRLANNTFQLFYVTQRSFKKKSSNINIIAQIIAKIYRK